MSTNEKNSSDRSSSLDSLSPPVKTPRTARFAEATSVYSPVDGRSPFADPPRTNHYKPQPQPSDVGLSHLPCVEMEETEQSTAAGLASRSPLSPAIKSPLKSALKSPGAPPRTPATAFLSPTFREEQILEKREEHNEKEQARDLVVKTRVRMAKMFLRGVNFACSLIVLSMLATSFSIFNATKTLPPRNNLPAWAQNTKTWPQITLLAIACVSLVMSVVVLAAYTRGGHKRAEKVQAYYTIFAVAFFIFSIVMWAIGAGILNVSKQNGKGKDMWGWSCVDNKRRQLFQEDVSYSLICRLQNWSLVCCIIEVVIETLCIGVYAIIFYRIWSKRRLRKSMATRDRARSDLYLAQLRSQSAPNTPGVFMGPTSPRSGGWQPGPPTPGYAADPLSMAENGLSNSVQYARPITQPQPFSLQAAPPPIKIQGATPRVEQNGFDAPPRRTDSASLSPLPPLPSPGHERQNDHVPAAPGEQTYAAVPIPGAYAPLSSPSYPSPTHAPPSAGFDFGPGVSETARRPSS